MLGPVFAIAVKDMRLLMRDGAALFFTFIFPMMVALFFGFIFSGGGDGGGGKMTVALVDQSGGPAAKDFIEDIRADESLTLRTQTGPKESPHPLTLDEGRNLVRLGDVTACIIIPRDFEKSSASMFGGGGLKIEAVVDP